MNDWPTAPLTACLDFLAECKGYTPFYLNQTWTHKDDPSWIVPHPCPATLDSIAACLPNGWVWHILGQCQIHFEAQARNEDFRCRRAEADTELLARARCACMAWEFSRKDEV